MSFQSTTSIIEALKSGLTGLRFPNDAVAYGALAGELMFQQVDVYDVPQVELAVRDLLNFKNRIALIFPRGERFEHVGGNGGLKITQTGEYLVVICDRDYAPGKSAFFGGPGQPGVLAMKEIVLAAAIGESLGIPGSVVVPVDGESVRIAESAQALAKGREGYRIFFDITMGSVALPLGRGTKRP